MANINYFEYSDDHDIPTIYLTKGGINVPAQIDLGVSATDNGTYYTVYVRAWGRLTSNYWVHSGGLGGDGFINGTKRADSITIFGNGNDFSASDGWVYKDFSGTVNKIQSSRTIRVYFDFWDVSEGSWGSNKYSMPLDITLDALASHTVSYNANAGTDSVLNMPNNQTKWYGTVLSLSTQVPTRENYDFIGWDTNANTTTPQYPAGQQNQYANDENIVLYAIWKLKGHWITYNTQGGTPIPTSYLKTVGTIGYITSIVPQKDGYKFKEWNNNSNGTGTTYSAGQGYTDSANLNLYAIWEKINNKNLKIKNENRWTPVTAADFNALTYNQLNTKIDNGLVPEGDGHPRCAWATDANGNPGWYAYASMFLPELGADVYPTNYDGSHGVGTIFLQKFGKIVFMTLNYLKTTSGWPSDFYSDQWYGQTPLIIPEEFRPLYKVHIPELLRVEQQGALSVCAAEDEHAGGIGWHSLASSGQTLSATTFWDTFMWLTPDDSEGD